MGYESEMAKRMNMNHQRRTVKKDLYETLPLFRGIDNKKDRELLKNALVEERFEAGDVIFNYGDVGDKFYVVMSGKV